MRRILKKGPIMANIVLNSTEEKIAVMVEKVSAWRTVPENQKWGRDYRDWYRPLLCSPLDHNQLASYGAPGQIHAFIIGPEAMLTDVIWGMKRGYRGNGYTECHHSQVPSYGIVGRVLFPAYEQEPSKAALRRKLVKPEEDLNLHVRKAPSGWPSNRDEDYRLLKGAMVIVRDFECQYEGNQRLIVRLLPGSVLEYRVGYDTCRGHLRGEYLLVCE